MDDTGRSHEEQPTREENGRPAEPGTGREAPLGPARSPANLVTWQLALYALVLGILCVFLIPLTTLWWIVPLLGVAGLLLLAFGGGGPGAGQNDRASPALSRRDASLAGEAMGAKPDPLDDSLSEREREVLAVLASGRTTSEAARDLFVSVGTVKSHTANIYRKLGAKNRAQAIARARELGLLP